MKMSMVSRIVVWARVSRYSRETPEPVASWELEPRAATTNLSPNEPESKKIEPYYCAQRCDPRKSPPADLRTAYAVVAFHPANEGRRDHQRDDQARGPS